MAERRISSTYLCRTSTTTLELPLVYLFKLLLLMLVNHAVVIEVRLLASCLGFSLDVVTDLISRGLGV